MLEKPWISCIPSKKQACYQPVTNCTYWPVLGSYKNLNIIELTPKSTPFEEFDEIHQVVIDGISEYTALLVQSGMYGDINPDETTANLFYVIKFISDAYMLQNNTTIDRTFISSGELFVKAQYLCSVQENTNLYWKQQPLKHTIIVPTSTILPPNLGVIMIRDVQDIPKNLCNRIQAKTAIQRHYIFMTDADYDYILDEFERYEKNEFERNVSVNSDEE